MSLRITYVLASSEMNGGHKVVFQHIRLLRKAGHEVTVVAAGPRPAWAGFDGPYHDSSAGPPHLAAQELVIATFWTTLSEARRLGAGPVAHFCQGYEGGLVHLAPLLPQIEEAYSWPVPALVVSPHLGDFLRDRFGRESAVAPPPLDPLFRPSRLPRMGPRRSPWIAVPGIFEAEVKGVPTALEAVRRLRGRGIPARVLRFTFLPLSPGERELLEPDRYLCGVPPEEIARVLRQCDLLLFPSRPEEGFGLPLLEAMASGVPAVSSRIPSTFDFAEGAVPLVAPGDVEGFTEAAAWLLSQRSAWRRSRKLGQEAARRFLPEAVAPRLLAAIEWARRAGAAS
jgi:glycosyltransferase involved in cell wall biosynthesis